MERWIKSFEKLRYNWVFNDHDALRIWLLLLWDVNYKDVKTRFEGQFIVVKKGQKITSIRKMAEEYGFTRYTLKRVLDDLEKDGMITRQKIGTHGTLLTIPNYLKYQGETTKKQEMSATDLTTDLTADLATDLTTDLATDLTQVYKYKNGYIKDIQKDKETAPRYDPGGYEIEE